MDIARATSKQDTAESGRGVIEKRQFERLTSQIRVRYHEIEGELADRMISDKTYKDITHPVQEKAKAVKDVMTVVTENISVGGLKLVGEKPFVEGKTLNVNLDLPGVPVGIQAIAVVVRATNEANENGKFSAGLRFVAINKSDVQKVESFIASRNKSEIEKTMH